MFRVDTCRLRSMDILALLAAILLHGASWPAEAHAPGVALSGVGTATIDGVLSPGEWDHAGRIDFLVNVPAADGGGTTPATLFGMNDGTNLYLALKIKRTSLGGVVSSFFEFDNNHNGLTRSEGDDVFGMNVGEFWPAQFVDDFRTEQAPCPPGFLCGLYDADHGGTTDGATAASNDGAFTYIELSHPLNSGDTQHDFSLAPGSIVGFTLNLRLFSLISPFDSMADTDFPTGCLSCPGAFGDIVIAAPVIPVVIDIKPGTFPNSVNPAASGVIPVAILTTSTFSATTVDPSTVRFGTTGTEAAAVHFTLQDVDGDGKADMILQFDTQSAGIVCGGTSASLTGKTVGGQAINGSDSIRTVGCR